MIHVHPAEHTTPAECVLPWLHARETLFITRRMSLLLHTPIKRRVMKLLWALSPQHCFIKDDTIIFYQLTKNADKLWFNKTQSVLREACWFLCSGVIAHELQWCLGTRHKNIPLTIKPDKKVSVMIIGAKSNISFVFDSFSLVMLSCIMCNILFLAVNWLYKSFHRQIWTPDFPCSEMHKQTWHLLQSKQRLMLYYRQSVISVNVCLSMIDDVSTTLKGGCFLNLKSCIFRDSMHDTPDNRPPTPCCLALTKREDMAAS